MFFSPPPPPPHPHLVEAPYTNPYEHRRLIQSLKTQSAPETGGISAAVLRNLSRKALVHVAQLFNYILMFEYFCIAWKSTKVIPIPKPGKAPSEPGSHRPIILLSALSRLLERVLAHRLYSFIHQNHAVLPGQFGFRRNNIQQCDNLPESPTVSPMALILENTQA